MPLSFNPNNSQIIDKLPGWKLQTANYNALPSDKLLIVTPEPWTLTLPQGKQGIEIDLLGVQDLTVHPLTINLNGAKFFGSIPASIQLVKNEYIKFIYIDENLGWLAVNASALKIQAVAVIQLFLDKYPNANIALSLRKLSSTYTGPCIRVRRSSDNSELDIGFFDNNLDVNALLSFVGSGDGFIFKWYNQSGKTYRFEQATLSRQPKIVTNGSLVIQNDKPSVRFDGTTHLEIPSISNYEIVASDTKTSIFAAFQSDVVEGALIGQEDPVVSGSKVMFHTPWDNGITYFDIGNASSGRVTANLAFSTFSIASFLSSPIRLINKNGQNILTKSISSNSLIQTTYPLSLGYIGDTYPRWMRGYISELIIYNSFVDSYSDIEADLNNYYQVF